MKMRQILPLWLLSLTIPACSTSTEAPAIPAPKSAPSAEAVPEPSKSLPVVSAMELPSNAGLSTQEIAGLGPVERMDLNHSLWEGHSECRKGINVAWDPIDKQLCCGDCQPLMMVIHGK